MKIFEARQLPGGNIHPVARVSAADQDKDSKIKKCTNNPSFNEVTFTFLKFYFTHVNTHFPLFFVKFLIHLGNANTLMKRRSNFLKDLFFYEDIKSNASIWTRL